MNRLECNYSVSSGRVGGIIVCNIVSLKDALSPLKESSRSAIADADCEAFDDIKRYLHLNRDIEEQLKSFLDAVKGSRSKKLFLVCGNVGDGKSHLLASIRINDPDLLEGVTLHNDATESSDPDTTFIDELNKLLNPFTDENVWSGEEKIVLAINLGTLNNFLEADEDNNFSKLKKYVKESKILDVGKIVECRFNDESPFQFVNFCDHNLFCLTDEGPKSQLIETAIERIVSSDGPFFKAYQEQRANYPSNCPICLNFELLRDRNNREVISNLLIKSMIQGEVIISIRALYNFIYELIIPVEFESLTDNAVKQRIESYSNNELLQLTIPNYIFSHPELSTIFEQIHKYDPAAKRGEELDQAVIELMISRSPDDTISKYIDQNTFNNIIRRLVNDASIDESYINSFFRFIYFWPEQKSNTKKSKFYDAYMRLMYQWYSGEEKAVKPLYKLIQDAVLRWKGDAGKNKINVNIGRQQLDYQVSEQITIKPLPLKPPMMDLTKVSVFNTFLPVKFKVNGSEVLLPVTYDLFKLASKISEGYRPTTLDHSNYLVFNDFVDQVAKAGEGRKQVYFTDSQNYSQKFVLELDDFGDFCFSEVTE